MSEESGAPLGAHDPGRGDGVRGHGTQPHPQQSQGSAQEGHVGKEQLFTQMIPEIPVLFLLQPVWAWLGLRSPLRKGGVQVSQGSVALPQVVERTMQWQSMASRGRQRRWSEAVGTCKGPQAGCLSWEVGLRSPCPKEERLSPCVSGQQGQRIHP